MEELMCRKRALRDELSEMRRKIKAARRAAARSDDQSQRTWRLSGEVLDVALTLYGGIVIHVADASQSGV